MKLNTKDFIIIESQFLCNKPVKQIQWQNVLNDLVWDDQKLLLDQTVNLKILERYPIKVDYIIRFLRYIIEALEAQNIEIHDELYEVLCKYQMHAQSDCAFSYKHYKIVAFNQLVTLKEAKSKISEGTTGLIVWEAALAVCEWAIHNIESIKDQHILELGSGTGLSGLVIAKCCRPASMTLTDGNDKVLGYLAENAKNNAVDNTRIKVLNVDWVSVAEDEANSDFSEHLESTKPNLIIAADVIYDDTLFQPLCETLDFIFLKCKNQCKFILANAVRNESTQKEFFDALGKYKFRTNEDQLVRPTHLHWEINSICPIKIYRIERNVND